MRAHCITTQRLGPQVWLTICLSSALLLQTIPASNAETVTLAQPQQFPLVINGKPVGKTSAPAGTQVEVVSKEGDRYLLKFRNAEPTWVDADKLKQPATTTNPASPNNGAEKASSPPQTVDVPSKLKELSSLVEKKSWKQLAEACQTLANCSEETMKSLAAMGSELSSALKNADLARQNKSKTAAEATRLRRNAKVIDRPNPLDERDTSPMERASKMREQAAELESQTESAITEADERIQDLALAIDDQIASARDSSNQTAEAGDDNSSDDSETAVGSFKLTPSLEFKGFSLNMSYDAISANIERQFGAMGQITSEDGIDKDACLIENIRKARYTTFSVGGEAACKAIWQPGTGRKYIARLILYHPFAARLFNAEDLEFEDFWNNFGAKYRMEKQFDIVNDKANQAHRATYKSGRGWSLAIDEQFQRYMIILERSKDVRSTSFGG